MEEELQQKLVYLENTCTDLFAEIALLHGKLGELADIVKVQDALLRSICVLLNKDFPIH